MMNLEELIGSALTYYGISTKIIGQLHRENNDSQEFIICFLEQRLFVDTPNKANIGFYKTLKFIVADYIPISSRTRSSDRTVVSFTNEEAFDTHQEAFDSFLARIVAKLPEIKKIRLTEAK